MLHRQDNIYHSFCYTSRVVVVVVVVVIVVVVVVVVVVVILVVVVMVVVVAVARQWVNVVYFTSITIYTEGQKKLYHSFTSL